MKPSIKSKNIYWAVMSSVSHHIWNIDNEEYGGKFSLAICDEKDEALTILKALNTNDSKVIPIIITPINLKRKRTY